MKCNLDDKEATAAYIEALENELHSLTNTIVTKDNEIINLIKTMKVRKLTSILKKVNQNSEVYMSSDAEGNDYHSVGEDCMDAYKNVNGNPVVVLYPSHDCHILQT